MHFERWFLFIDKWQQAKFKHKAAKNYAMFAKPSR